MKMRPGRLVCLASLLALSCIAALACGGGDGGSTAQPTPTTDSRTALAEATIGCDEVPPGSEGSASIEVRSRDDGTQYYLRPYILLPSGSVYVLEFEPATDPTRCDLYVQSVIAAANDQRLYGAVATWVAAERNGELVGACKPGGNTGADPARDDYCYFLPTRLRDDFQIRVGRPQSDDVSTLVVKRQPDGSWTVTGIAPPEQ